MHCSYKRRKDIKKNDAFYMYCVQMNIFLMMVLIINVHKWMRIVK